MVDDARRTLGVPSLAALVAANMIGAGVFTSSGFALADLGSPKWVLIAWALGGLLAVLGALSYGALAMRIHGSGGEYLFLSNSLHPAVGFLAGWVSILAGFTGAIALAAEAAQAYAAPWLPEDLAPDWIGSAAIVAAGLIHARGVHIGAWVQNGVVTIKVLLLVALVVVGWSHLPANPAQAAVAPAPAAFVVTMMWISLSYSGWNAAVYIGGEARQGRRTLPRAMLWATGLVTALYLALNAIFVYSAPIAELAGKRDIAAVAARLLAGPGLESLVRVILLLALCTSISSMVMIGPRVLARMAQDGWLPRALAFQGEVPRAAIWTQVALAILVLWSSGLRAQLTNLGWILGLFTALAVLGLLRLRQREGAQAVPIPGGVVVPVLFLLATLTLTVAMLVVGSGQLLPSLGILASGCVVYALRHGAARRA
ncbi:MAG: APC family permease [Planctomycetota bacterium]